MGDRGHNRHGPKRGRGCCAVFAGGAGSPSNTMWLGPRFPSVPSGILIHPALSPEQTWAENWGLCPFLGRGAGFPSNSMWPGPRPTCMPSFILIHPTVWPQYTNVTDWQDRQRSDSIGEPSYKRSPKNSGRGNAGHAKIPFEGINTKCVRIVKN